MKVIRYLLPAMLMFLAFGCSTGSKSEEEKGTKDIAAETAAPSGAEPEAAQPAQLPAHDASLPTVIDFSATWCGPCRMFAPIFHKVAEEYKGKANFLTVDIDERKDLAEAYDIQAVPTTVYLDKEGRELNRITGAPSEADFVAAVNKLIAP